MSSSEYRGVVGPDLWAFIERTASFYPENAADLPIPAQRALYDEMSRAMRSERPATVTIADGIIPLGSPGLRFRRYMPSDDRHQVAILYFHGGGFVMGNLDSHDDICAEICEGTGFTVFSLDYRLAPENPHPAAFDDALAAFEWLSSTVGTPVILCGDSAGGNLAAAIAHCTRDREKKPVAQMLIYPLLGGDPTGALYEKHHDAPMLTRRDVEFYQLLRIGSASWDDPSFAPLNDKNFASLPPTVVVTAQFDPLAIEGQLYRDRLAASGCVVTHVEEPALVHGYLRARRFSQKASDSFKQILQMLSILGTEQTRE